MTILILANNWDVWSEIVRYEIATIPYNTPSMKKGEHCVSTLRFHVDGKGQGFSWNQKINYITTVVIRKFIMIEN